MSAIILERSAYRDKVRGCWLGKNIGSTLGMPIEGIKEPHALTFYGALPNGAAANDDLDFQLVWLALLEQRGLHPRLSDFADYWMRCLARYPWNEYGICQRNLARGLRPPISGCFENYFVDELGAPVRSELWACVAAGDPQLAAAMAWQDAVLDHAGGEGVWGEMFWAAVESAAFVISDPMTLIRIGLEMIPTWSRVSRAVREAVWCYSQGLSWAQARERILRGFGDYHPCDAPQNFGFIIMGWLYGKDFGDRMCQVVNCGYDTDSTGAALGALLGIISGASALPQQWIAPIGDDIVLHQFTQLEGAPRTVAELTERTAALAQDFLARRSDVAALGDRAVAPPDLLSLLSRNDLARERWTRDVHCATEHVADGVEIMLDYHGEPVLRPGIAKKIGLSAHVDEAPAAANLALSAPPGWRVTPIAADQWQASYLVQADAVPDRSRLGAVARIGNKRYETEFVLLGPGEARGFGAGDNVATCPRCHARAEACFCQDPPST